MRVDAVGSGECIDTIEVVCFGTVARVPQGDDGTTEPGDQHGGSGYDGMDLVAEPMA